MREGASEEALVCASDYRLLPRTSIIKKIVLIAPTVISIHPADFSLIITESVRQ